MKTTSNNMISTHFSKAKRRGYNYCTMENLPKKDGAYPKREMTTKTSLIDYKSQI